MLLSLVVGVAAISLWTWQSLHEMQVFCEQAVLDKHAEIVRRDQLEKAAAAEKRRAERAAQRVRTDADSRIERLKWTAVIEAATEAIQTELAQASKPVVKPAGFEPVIETDKVEIDASKTDAIAKGDAAAEAAAPASKDPADVNPVEADAEYWSFKRLSSVEPPDVADASWCRNPIDHFILAKLKVAGLSPNPTATRQVLARRLWFDSIGLPPRPDDVDAFVEDTDRQAYELLVDQLMSDPAFGERWARVWLDLARYADSNGYEEDEIRPHAFPYRDFVIWAMNIDLPFDLFTRWQIAGDELQPENPLAVAATGFFTAAPLNTFIPQESERFDELDDMVATMSSAMLGLSVGCARCHDHLYDPILTNEYYGLVAIFAETERKQSFLVPDGGKEYRQWFDPVDVRRQEIRQMLEDRVKEDNISGARLLHRRREEPAATADRPRERRAGAIDFAVRTLPADHGRSNHRRPGAAAEGRGALRSAEGRTGAARSRVATESADRADADRQLDIADPRSRRRRSEAPGRGSRARLPWRVDRRTSQLGRQRLEGLGTLGRVRR